ncbi:MAG: YggS family pyridoxal phosphate-dependent enzyme [Clostridia bacterium]|nr:YggS family pyridoxal phosphate-dependent enzyme [Clostridia bacterium]
MEKWFADDIRENLCRIEESIAEACVRAGRRRDEVTLVGVTKTVDAERVNAALAAGLTHIGENYVQELLAKKPLLNLDGVSLELIGHLQTNKVKQVLPQVDRIQSVDSLRLASAISKAAVNVGKTASVLVEVNIGEEESKTGLPKEQLFDLLAQMSEMPALSVEGLMCIPPFYEKSEQRRKVFSEMYQMFLDIRDKKLDNVNMHTLSMGMSADVTEAILEGSTMVRVGTALFGARNYAK